MSKYCVVEITYDKKDEVDKTKNELLAKRLVASCHVLETENSYYVKGERKNKKEYLFDVITMTTKVDEIRDVVKSIHSSEFFEFASYPITSIKESYLDWIDKKIDNE